MANFPLINVEPVVQVGEKIRIDCTKCFVSRGGSAITEITVVPEVGVTPISVFNSNSSLWYLDWVYLTAGTKAITVAMTATTTTSASTSISCVTVASDLLFSSDNNLKSIENDIMKWLPDGKSTWASSHRKAQEIILNTIYKSNVLYFDMTKITKAAFIDISEVTEWSAYLTLSIIYNSLSNAVDDVFGLKSKMYEQKATAARVEAFNRLSLDYNKDASLSTYEVANLNSGTTLNR